MWELYLELYWELYWGLLGAELRSGQGTRALEVARRLAAGHAAWSLGGAFRDLPLAKRGRGQSEKRG